LKYTPYNSDTVISIQISQLYYNEDTVVDVINNNKTEKLKLKLKKRKNIPYIHIKFKNLYHSESFLTIMNSIINSFVIKKSNELNTLLADLEFKKEKDVDENLKKLKNIAPDAFVEGYANFCDARKRPSPIDKKDIKNYIKSKSKEFNFKAGELETFKQQGVLDFKLANDEVIHLVCDYPDDKYPYLKSTLKSKKLTQLDKTYYDELPCCKILPPKLDKNAKKETSHIMGFNIITNPGTTGELKPDVKYFLQYYNNSLDNNFIRMGVVNDSKSLLHCLCLATNDELYKDTKNKSIYVDNLLVKIAEKINYGLLKQELYDMSLDEIKESFLNNNFLDPNLYYRAFEEYYNFNIYVFNQDTMELPRFNMFHSRPVRDYRDTILISKQNNQCELIINHSEMIFDKKMSTYCHSFLQKILNTITITQTDNYNNMYSYADHLTFFDFKGKISQYIDNQGKLRSLTFNLKNEKLTLITIPSQPENLPIQETIEYCHLDTALKIMNNQPSAVAVENDEIVGLWFNIYDIKEGEFIPVLPHTNNMKLPEKLFPLLNVIDNETLTNYSENKKLVSFVLQIIQWLYILALYKFNIVDGLQDFLNQFVTVRKNKQSIYDDVLLLPRRYPVYEHFESYIEYLQEHCPKMMHKGKLIIYNDLFNVQIEDYLKYYDLTYHKVPLLISGYYENLDDFNQNDLNKNHLIFLNKENLTAWENQNTKIDILTTILPYTPYPFLYQHVNNQIYIIQYVAMETLEEAMTLCDVWINKKHNMGYHVVSENIKKQPTIYKTTDNNQIELIQKGNSNYNIINYDYKPEKAGKYAAMLMI
jgi:hypothetical protein